MQLSIEEAYKRPNVFNVYKETSLSRFLVGEIFKKTMSQQWVFLPNSRSELPAFNVSELDQIREKLESLGST